MREKFAEYPTTTWKGVKIRVEVSHPELPHTLTSQMILDRYMMDNLYYINPPKDFEFIRMPERIFEYNHWKQKNKKAHDLVDMVAKNIANHLLRVLEKEIAK